MNIIIPCVGIDKQKKDLIIFTHGYPSKEWMAMLSDQKIKFLMIFQKSFNQLINESTQEDYYTDLNYQKKTYKVRIIKLKLSSDEIEVLVINIGIEFMERCFKRWPSKPNTTPLKIN